MHGEQIPPPHPPSELINQKIRTITSAIRGDSMQLSVKSVHLCRDGLCSSCKGIHLFNGGVLGMVRMQYVMGRSAYIMA